MENSTARFRAGRTGVGDDALPNRYEAECFRHHLANVLAGCLGGRRDRSIERLREWLQDNSVAIGLPELGTKAAFENGKADGDAQSFIRFALSALRDRKAVAPSSLEWRLRWIATTLKLGNLNTSILKLVTRAILFRPIFDLTNAGAERHANEGEVYINAIALLLGQPKQKIFERLRRNRPLRQFGLIEDRGGGDFAPSRTVLRLARLRRCDSDGMRRELFGRMPDASLDWTDFDHLGPARDLVCKLMGAALRRHEHGIGVLFYGVPGTGKTEFAKALAKRLAATAVFIGETDDSDGEPSREERVSHYALTGALAERAGRAILVVDEADDMFTGVDDDDHASRTGSKVFMNRLVERCPTPTIWITNNPGRLGPAVMRRMTFALRFREPGRDIRRRMIERLALAKKVRLSPAETDRLAGIDVAPALVAAGLRAAALTRGKAPDALTALASLQDALGRRPAAPLPAGAVPFDPALSAADCDLQTLADRVQASFSRGTTALSFCFHGLPGTGKSAYARFLAERLGLEVIEKRASDLLSMWLGGTEQNMATAFTEAAERRAMLIIDEADSLLRDRAGAVRSWEVSQVNEMLTWMERHPYPFACTTNAMACLDPATLRRFLFKVEFLPMDAAQIALAFRRAFGLECPDFLVKLEPLTPGDFAVVARKAAALGERDGGQIARWLAEEVSAKPEGRKVRMGF